ncbi:MAG TPA: AAA family ATPase [Blastocatellia bacterium]|nr:AAA family ATPase [Blastocatellia bacterium]
MPVDRTVIDAITTAVEADPANVALRLHLVSLLIDAARPADALEHCGAVLRQEPDNVDALEKAVRAATAAGDTKRAESYRRLLTALTNTATNTAKSDASKDWPDELPPDFGLNTPVKRDEPKKLRLNIDQGEFGGDDDDNEWDVEIPNISLADVAGLEQVKRRLNLAFLGPLKNPEMMKLYGKSVRGGLLLYGPPGCGKTFIARATSGELGARFIAVGLSDVLDMWLGQSEKNINRIFEKARRNAPCVLFFDEIDALGRKRSQLRHGAGSNAVTQLLNEMDSVNANNEGVFVLAATNHPWDVDTALRRPGRLDRTLLVLPPDEQARRGILDFHLSDRPIDKLDLSWIANKTDEFSGADLAHLCESAAELAMHDSIESGTARPINMNDFKQAMKEIKPSTRPWLEMARNYAMFANDGGIYDDLYEYLRNKRII